MDFLSKRQRSADFRTLELGSGVGIGGREDLEECVPRGGIRVAGAKLPRERSRCQDKRSFANDGKPELPRNDASWHFQSQILVGMPAGTSRRLVSDWRAKPGNLVRDQGVGGSNPFSPTISFQSLTAFQDPSSFWAVVDFVAVRASNQSS
jgi:hypothetical protein